MSERALIDGTIFRDRLADLVRQADCVDLAVAYVGRSACRYFEGFSGTFRAVVNISSGATKPFEIEEILKSLEQTAVSVEIRNNPRLHSKLYRLGSVSAVGSANRSANGMGQEGDELAGSYEDLVIADDSAFLSAAQNRFDTLWNAPESAPVMLDGSILRSAKDEWTKRRHARPGPPPASKGGSSRR